MVKQQHEGRGSLEVMGWMVWTETHAMATEVVRTWQRQGSMAWLDKPSPRVAVQALTDSEALHCEDESQPPPAIVVSDAISVASSTRMGSDTVVSGSGTRGSSSLQSAQPVQPLMPPSIQVLLKRP